MAIPVKETVNKVIRCGVCGAKLELNMRYHYIARDNGVTGAVTVFTKEQEKPMYDAFDCPVCGCQYIAQERKRTLFDVFCSDEPSDDDTETSDKIEETSDKEENLECKGCEFEGDVVGNPVFVECLNCRRAYADRYRKKQ